MALHAAPSGPCIGSNNHEAFIRTDVRWWYWKVWRWAWSRKDLVLPRELLFVGSSEVWARICGRLWFRDYT